MDLQREHVITALGRAQDVRGFRLHELTAAMTADARGRHRVRALLSELIHDGVVEKTEGSRYRLVGWQPALVAQPLGGAPAAVAREAGAAARSPSVIASPGLVSGAIRVHPAGYGFVVRDDGEGDVFVAARNRGAALDGDRVALATWVGYKGIEGRVMEVLGRGRARLTGTLQKTGYQFFLEPDDPRIHGQVLLEGGAGGARQGQAVVVEILGYPTEPDQALLARVSRVLGEPDDPRTEVAKVIACAEIPDEFPDEVLRAAAGMPSVIAERDLVDRVDLRDRPFMTIDPEVARDFDDAVCVEDGPGGTDRLWVAVADVSHYVRPTSAIDREAALRGVSVYLPDRAIPMLPPELSSGLCSLLPEQDRLAMVARIDVDPRGAITGTQLVAAVIRSRARFDYHGVAAALGGDTRGPRARYRDFLPQLERLDRVARRLRAIRRERGSLDFELPEAQVVLDEDDPRRVREVRKSRSLAEVRDAYRLIEDCMLAANEAVAALFAERGLDTLWRVHDVPREERLEGLIDLAESFGIQLAIEDCRSPRRLRGFLDTITGHPAARSLGYLLLRSLKQASYDVVNVGHFALASAAYLHFTSPIRRYPDLVVHRLLKRLLRREGLPAGGGEMDAGPAPARTELGRTAGQASACERRAMEAEREVVDVYRAYLMRDRIGEQYPGTIVATTSFGLFVEIADPFVEGRVRIESLGDGPWVLDERHQRLVAKASGRAFALGDQVTVEIENVSVPRRKIDFTLVGHAPSMFAPAAADNASRRPRRRPSPGGQGHPAASAARPPRRKR